MIVKRVILICFIALMALPTVNTIYPFITSAKLEGAVTYAPDTSFTISGWWRGSFQEQKEQYLNDYFGFRPDFVRLHNQVEYSLFHNIYAKGVVEGLDHYLYEDAYIDSYYGRNYRGSDSLYGIARQLKGLQDIIESRGKKMLMVMAPGKANIYPEYIPYDLRQERGMYNGDTMATYYNSLGIEFLNANQWFKSIRDKMPYPLMTKYNTHWSAYGTALAADTIIKRLEIITGKDLPDFSFDCIESDTMVQHDREMMVSLNLIFPLPQDQKTCIPETNINDSGKTKLNALVLGDSFFWEMYYLKIPHRMFGYFEFWFYANEIYGPDGFIAKSDNERLEAMIDKADVIIYVASEGYLEWYKWSLPDVYEVMGYNINTYR